MLPHRREFPSSRLREFSLYCRCSFTSIYRHWKTLTIQKHFANSVDFIIQSWSYMRMDSDRIKFNASRFSNNWFYCREKILNKSQTNVFDKKLRLTRFSKNSRKSFRFYLSHFYPSAEYSRFASARTLVVFIRNCCDSDIVTHETPGDISRQNSTSMVFETLGIYNTNKILKKVKK